MFLPLELFLFNENLFISILIQVRTYLFPSSLESTSLLRSWIYYRDSLVINLELPRFPQKNIELLYSFPGAAILDCHKLSNLKQQKFILLQEARSLKARCWQGWLLLEALRKNPSLFLCLFSSFQGCQQSCAFWLPGASLQFLPLLSHGTLPTCLSRFFSSFKTIVMLDSGPTLSNITPV